MASSHRISTTALRQATIDRASMLLAQGAFHGVEALLSSIADDTRSDAFVQHLRAMAAAGLGQMERANELLSISIRLNPADATAHANLGTLLAKDHRHAPAAAAYEAALLLQPSHRNALIGVAKSYAELGLFDLAIDAYGQAVANMPDDISLKLDLASLVSDAGDRDDALRLFGEALIDAPDRADIYTARAMTLFATGDWIAAWQDYEWRWQDQRYHAAPAPEHATRWLGCDLHGKTILLQPEQGLGDTIQFVRYAPLVKARGARVILQAPRALLPLLHPMPGIDLVVASDMPTPPCDLWAPLLSLPGLFGTTPGTVPGTTAYLNADPILADQWKQRLDLGPGLRVGIAWQGNPAHGCDRWRSMRLLALAPLLACSGVRFVSLQQGAGSDQLAPLSSMIRDPSAIHPVTSFADTAAIIANLDLVISVDTSVAHLAGAMGKPVWLLLAARNDWRWMRDGNLTPWYPSMTLYRQNRLHDWASVITRVQDALCKQIGTEPVPVPAASSPPRDDTAICDALFACGIRLHRNGNVAGAMAAFQRLLRTDPRHVGALSNLGALERDCGNIAQALTLLRRAAHLVPDSVDVGIALADALLAADDIANARAHYSALLKHAHGRADVHAGLARACHAGGDHAAAISHFEKAVHLNQCQPAIFYQALGQSLIAMERLPGAAVSLQHALRLDPTLTTSHDMLLFIQRRMQGNTEALAR